jgi:hypothetical protein
MPGIIPQVIVAAVTAVAQNKVKTFMNAQLNMGTKKAPPSGRALEVRRRCYALAVAKRVT